MDDLRIGPRIAAGSNTIGKIAADCGGFEAGALGELRLAAFDGNF